VRDLSTAAGPAARVAGGHRVGPQLRGTACALARAHDVLLLDLDGVVYAGPRALPGAADRLARCRQAGARLGYVTNNASRTPQAVAEQLLDLGVEASEEAVVTSAQAAARLLAERLPDGSRVLVVGGEGLVAALIEQGLEPVWSADDDPAAVAQGFHPSVGWAQLAEGAYALATGVVWVASNLDRTVPTERGTAPGNGTLVEALRTATGREPVVAGKPEPALFDEAIRRLGGRLPLVVGDRIDTDIAGARRSGLPSLLVLTGVSTLADVCTAQGEDRPDYVAPDLEGLLLEHPEVRRHGASFGCAGATATIDGSTPSLVLAGAGAPAVLAGLRALVAACWVHDDPGSLDLGPATQTLHEMMAVAPRRSDARQ